MTTNTLDKRLTPARPDLADERLRDLVEASRFVRGTPHRVIAPSAALRREPYPDAPLDTEALMGEAVTVYEETEGFAWVQLEGDGYVGYMSAESLGPATPPPAHRVTAIRTFLYPGPSLKLPPLGHLPLGAGVTPVEEKASYRRLATGGWVFAGHLEPADAHAGDYVAIAERLRGVPYLWGGKTSLGLDCSGLVQLAMAMAGMDAPRDSDLQAEGIGRPVEVGPDLAGLQRGDLVFWRGHVGIMLDADTLLHANGHHMATEAEPLRQAEARILETSYGPITGFRRPERLGA